ncbi:MAG: ABC transporter, partial [Lachnospiraceae bacterium]|nr:ABC transporter [Lachnospiraceae bacterium]
VGLDPGQIIEMRELIKNLATEHAVILSSHILSEVSAVCDHVMIINKGKLVVADSPENLSKHLERQGEVSLGVKGEKSRILSTLNAVIGVNRVEFERVSEGIVYVTVYTGKEDLRESIFYALATAGLPIFEMRVVSKSLEDIFVTLTGDDAKEAEKLMAENDNKEEAEISSEDAADKEEE